MNILTKSEESRPQLIEELTQRFDRKAADFAAMEEDFTLRGFGTAANLMCVEKETWTRAAEIVRVSA